jgi:hypothetical protein
MISGFFTSVNNDVNARSIARLNGNGSVDSSFSSAAFANSFVGIECMAQQPDGKLVVGGSFTQVGGITQFRLTRLNLDGTVDPTFRPGTGADGTVNALAIGPDTGIVLGGAIHQSRRSGAAGHRASLGRWKCGATADFDLTTSAVDSTQLRISWTDVDWRVRVEARAQPGREHRLD